MEPKDSLLHVDSDSYGGAEVFAAVGEVYAIYLPAGMQINGYGNGQLEISWTVPEAIPSQVVIVLIAIRAGDSSARTITQ
jgi:hypothetical protein